MRVIDLLIVEDSTRTTNGTVLPSIVVVVAVSGGYGAYGSSSFVNLVVTERAYQSARVATEQSSSSGLPKPESSVWQMNGVWCGPEITGPVMGWSVTARVARREPVGPVATAVSRLAPGLNPRTAPVWSGPSETGTFVPSISTARSSPGCRPRTAMRASSPVTVDGRLETTANSICPAGSGGVTPPNQDASTVGVGVAVLSVAVPPDAAARSGGAIAATSTRAAATKPRRLAIRDNSGRTAPVPLGDGVLDRGGGGLAGRVQGLGRAHGSAQDEGALEQGDDGDGDLAGLLLGDAVGG